MANVFSTINTEYLGNLILDEFVQTLYPLKAFTVSATSTPAFRGDVVKVLTMATASVALDYTNAYTMQQGGATGVDVTLNKHKYTSVELFDSEWRDSGLLETEHFARSKGAALAKSILVDLMTFVSSSFLNVTQSVQKSTAFSGSAVVDLSAYADSLNWPDYSRTLVLSPSQHTFLRKDPVVQQAFSYGNAEVIQKGIVPSLDTFSTIIKSPVVPAGSVGFCAVPNAVIFASRVVSPQEPNQYSSVKILTDESTGLSLTELVWHNPDAGSRRVGWACEFGFSLGNPNGAFLLL